MIVNRTKDILSKYNLYAKKKYGQNFLINPQVLNKIIDNSTLNKEKGVIEIGPGIGTLTEMLALNSKKVLCYEIDKDLIEVLKETLSEHKNIILINNDFLKVDLQEDIKKYFSDCSDIVVVANLPYYITTPIIFKLLQEESIKKIIIMVQKEVGLRLTGKPNTKDYNALSVLMAYKTKSRIFANVSRNSFLPAPNVDSVLLDIEVVKNDYKVNNEDNFLEFVQVIFMQRRKTLINNISAYYSIEKEDLMKLIESLGYDKDIRAESLTVEEIVNLYKRLFE